MAKLGEGDDRWIVKEREDGANCNNWHWTTKNITSHVTEALSAAVRMRWATAQWHRRCWVAPEAV